MKNIIKIYIILLLLIFYNLTLQAQGVSYNQEFQVNTYTGSDQCNPSISYLDNGDFVISWQSINQSGNGWDIYGQIFKNDGSKRDIEFLVNTDINGHQEHPSVSHLTNGNFVVCWSTRSQSNSNGGIYGQLFNNNGSKQDAEFQVNTYINNSQENPNVSNLTNGNFVICWEKFDQDSDSNIYGKLFNSNGSKQNSEFRVNSNTKFGQGYPIVNHLTNGDFVICWESYGQDGSCYGVYGQLFNSNGNKKGTEFQVNTHTKNSQYNPSVSHLINGDFVVCWVSAHQDSSGSGIYGQFFHNDGSKQGTEFQMNTYTDNDQRNPSVGHLTNGDFIVCWQGYGQDSSNNNIFTQLFNNDGSKQGIEFKINTYINSDQYNPSVSDLSNGKFVICWESEDQDESSSGIFAKYYLYPPITHPLNPFSLLEPEFDEVIATVNIPLKWRQPSPIRVNLPYEIEYHLYLDNNENFSNPQIIKAIYDTTCTLDSLTPGTTYFWKVLAKNISRDSLWSSETKGFFVSYDATGVEETSLKIPQNFQLHANFPNPFNPETTIKYSLPAEKALYQVVIKIYDALGKLVLTLKDEPQKPGVYTVKWNGKDAASLPMPSGIYFCVIQAGTLKAVQKMLLVK